ncbi:hypothetical protein [Rhodopirellula sp. P2]|uniref:hypothetical protein n=1 Tax=Rhodopirellula sp. P2 TaxID=2127060 RepID=UPI002368CAF5|nr:hypothetical protein [Rhodopirellula sp. P2]WDQ14741.1 hypothetical protein PSR62_13935 [Rhodopirellula sp. P2]
MITHAGALLLAGAAIAVTGCDGTSPKTTTASTTFVTVVYDGTPLANVQVLLKQSPGGATLDRAVTNSRGVAHFHALPSPEPESYVVAMESISDGGWMLKASVMEKLCDSLRLKPFSETPQQTIELPRRAVQSLSSIH